MKLLILIIAIPIAIEKAAVATIHSAEVILFLLSGEDYPADYQSSFGIAERSSASCFILTYSYLLYNYRCAIEDIRRVKPAYRIPLAKQYAEKAGKEVKDPYVNKTVKDAVTAKLFFTEKIG